MSKYNRRRFWKHDYEPKGLRAVLKEMGLSGFEHFYRITHQDPRGAKKCHITERLYGCCYVCKYRGIKCEGRCMDARYNEHMHCSMGCFECPRGTPGFVAKTMEEIMLDQI